MRAEYIDHMGNDLSVVNAAKVSFAARSESIGDREKSLIYFLARGCPEKEWKNNVVSLANMHDITDIENFMLDLRHMATHWTPFTHTSISLRMSAPVPIRTQCFKHKIGFTENEESRRYISSRPEIHVPEFFRSKAVNVKQGSGDVHEKSDVWLKTYVDLTGECIDTYEAMIMDGICPEQARFVLPQGVVVNWVWTGNLASFARFYNQRTDSHAQKEVQFLARSVGDIIHPLYPVSWAALTGE